MKLSAVVSWIAGFLFAAVAAAHDARPIYVEITESEETVTVEWKTPSSVPAFNVPEIVLPDAEPLGPVLRRRGEGGNYVAQRLFQAPIGERVEIRYPVAGVASPCLIRLKLASSEEHVKLLPPGAASWRIPEREHAGRIALEYAVLGVRHIFEGVDHLLFVLCLLLVAGNGRRMILTITGFTVAHSLTLALSVLGWVRVPIAPVEAVIALSIVFLASEIASGDREGWTYRYPVAVSGSFGLLHGFGFASVLREIGLPQTETPLALLFFNLGVEIGQILFVGILLALFSAAVFLLRNAGGEARLSRLEKPLVYAVGILAVYWTTERIASFGFI